VNEIIDHFILGRVSSCYVKLFGRGRTYKISQILTASFFVNVGRFTCSHGFFCLIASSSVFFLKSYQLGGTIIVLGVILVAIISTSSCKNEK